MRAPVICQADPRCVTAFHESGHAITALIHGLNLRGVSIIERATSSGRATLAKSFGHHEPWRLAVFLLAGPAAETHFTDAPYDARRTLRCARHAAGDYATAFDLLEVTRKVTESTDALMERYKIMADATVLLQWDWITAVARALVMHKALMAADVRALKPDGRPDE